MDLTPIERKLFKEQVIRDYRMKQGARQPLNDIFIKIKRNMALTIFIGLLAAIGLVYLSGWRDLLALILSGLVWLAMISTGLTVLQKTK
jgi:hypothetical protein